jgi:hypothetical protein
LRGEPDLADELLRQRFNHRIAESGHAFQRFSPFFAGALVAALGPADTQPDVDWLRHIVLRPAFPRMWVAHRAVVALLLAERTRDRQLAREALALLSAVPADPVVWQWMAERAHRV